MRTVVFPLIVVLLAGLEYCLSGCIVLYYYSLGGLVSVKIA